jgi:P-type Ca2+ transporter type 2C
MSLIPVLLKWPLALLPVHIVFLELIIDPACSVVFEMESDEADIMRRPPRRLEDQLFGKRMILTGLVQGVGVLAVVLAVYAFVLSQGLGEFEARMMSFASPVIANLGLILTNRSWTRPIVATLRVPNPALWWVVGGAAVFLALTIWIPFLRGLFSFGPLHAWEVGFIAVAGMTSILVSESVKTTLFQKMFIGASKKMNLWHRVLTSSHETGRLAAWELSY